MWSSFVGFMLRRYPRVVGLCEDVPKRLRFLSIHDRRRPRHNRARCGSSTSTRLRGWEGLSRNDEGVRAALALCAQYRGEQTIAIGLGGLAAVRAGAVAKLVREAARLVDPWGEEARI